MPEGTDEDDKGDRNEMREKREAPKCADGIATLLTVIGSVCLLLVAAVTAIQIALYADFGFYEREYTKYNVLPELEMDMDDTMHVTHEMMDYLVGKRESLDDIMATVAGKEREFFNADEKAHMDDVWGLFQGGLMIRRISVVGMILCFAACRLLKKSTRGRYPVIFRRTLYVSIAVLAALGIGFASNFSRAFVIFHEIFFDNDLWIMDPATDLMIRMLPEGFFADCVLRIGVTIIVVLVLLWALSFVVARLAQRAGRR